MAIFHYSTTDVLSKSTTLPTSPSRNKFQHRLSKYKRDVEYQFTKAVTDQHIWIFWSL